MRRAVTAGVALAVVLLAVPAAPAGAAIRFHDCEGVQCGRLAVPLDRSGTVAGQVSLYVERLRAARRPRRGATLLLAGGPGQPATYAYDSGFGPDVRYEEWQALTPRNDIVVFDQRGTGRSGLLRCRDLESASTLDAGTEAASCAVMLGRRRGSYRTADTVADIEQIRAELGAERLTIIGVSYGTYVAEAYAREHPTHVDRLVLDSVLDVTGVEPLYRDSFRAVPRVLTTLCRAGCRRFTRDPVADTEGLVGRLAAAPLRGVAVGVHGERRRVELTRPDLMFTLAAGDLDDISRAAFPGAVVSALRGDSAPLLRLRRRAIALESSGTPREFSSALMAATLCEEVRFPWARPASPDERQAAIDADAALIPPEQLRPFDAATAAGNDLVRLCKRWPHANAEPASADTGLPDVPVLLVEGEGDLRTPVETAERVAARFPRSRLLVAPYTGHSALSADLSGCLIRALDRFLSRRPLTARCPRGRPVWVPPPPVPASLRAVPPIRGAHGTRAGRTLQAVSLTIYDMAEELVASFLGGYVQMDGGRFLGAGLRRGHFSFGVEGVRVQDVEFVPGVRLSGAVRRFGTRRQRGVLKVSGRAAARGTLRLSGRRVRGRLGGRRVNARVPIGVFASGSDGVARSRPALRWLRCAARHSPSRSSLRGWSSRLLLTRRCGSSAAATTASPARG